MIGNEETLLVKFGADIKELTRGIDISTKEIENFGRDVGRVMGGSTKNVQTASKNINKSMSSVNNNIKETTSSMSKLSKAFAGLGTFEMVKFEVMNFANASKDLLDIASEYKALGETYKTVMRDMLGESDKFIRENVNKFGASVPELQRTMKDFYGFSLAKLGIDNKDQAMDYAKFFTTAAQDIQAFTDKDYDSVVEMLMGLQKGNYERTDNFGFNFSAKQVNDWSKAQYGKAFDDLEQTEKMVLLTNKLKQQMSDVGMVGFAEKESGNFQVQWRNLTENMKQAWSDFADTNVLGDAENIVKSISDKIAMTDWTSVGEAFRPLYESAKATSKEIYSQLLPAIISVKDIVSETFKALSESGFYQLFKDAVKGVLELVGATGTFLNEHPKITSALGDLLSYYIQFKLIGKILKGFDGVLGKVIGKGSMVADTLKGVMPKKVNPKKYTQHKPETFTTKRGSMGGTIKVPKDPVKQSVKVNKTKVAKKVKANNPSSTTKALNNLSTKFPSIAKGLSSIGKLFTKIMPFILSFGGLIKTALAGVVAFLGGISAPVWGIVAGIIAAIVGIIAVIKNWGSISDWLIAKWEDFKKWIQPFTDWCKGAWDSVKEWWVSTWESISDFFKRIWSGLVDFATKYIKPIVDIVVNVVTSIWNFIKPFLQFIVQGVAIIVAMLVTVLVAIVQSIWDTIKNICSLVWETLKFTVKVIVKFFEELVALVWDGITWLGEKLAQGWNWLCEITSNAWSWIVDTVSGWWNSLCETATSVFNWLSTFFSDLWEDITEVAENAWEGFRNMFGGKVGEIVDGAVEAFKSFGNTLVGVWDGIKSGIGSVISWLTSKINSLIDLLNSFSFTIPDFVPKALGGGKTIGFNISHVGKPKEFATGGIVTKATNSILGEAGSEAVVPLSNKSRMKPFAKAVGQYIDGGKSNKGGDTIFNIQATVREEQDIKKLARELDRLQSQRNRAKGKMSYVI